MCDSEPTSIAKAQEIEQKNADEKLEAGDVIKSEASFKSKLSLRESARSENITISEEFSDKLQSNSLIIEEQFKAGASEMYKTIRNQEMSPISSLYATDGSAQLAVRAVTFANYDKPKVEEVSPVVESEKGCSNEFDFLSPKMSADSKQTYYDPDTGTKNPDDASSASGLTSRTFRSPSLISETCDQMSSQSNSLLFSSNSEESDPTTERSRCSDVINSSSYFSNPHFNGFSDREKNKNSEKSENVGNTLDTESELSDSKIMDKYASINKTLEENDSSITKTCSFFSNAKSSEELSSSTSSKMSTSSFTSANTTSSEMKNENTTRTCSNDSIETLSSDLDSSLGKYSQYTHESSNSSTRALLEKPTKNEFKLLENVLFVTTTPNKPPVVQKISQNASPTTSCAISSPKLVIKNATKSVDPILTSKNVSFQSVISEQVSEQVSTTPNQVRLK